MPWTLLFALREHAKEYTRQSSGRNKPAFGQSISQGISQGPD